MLMMDMRMLAALSDHAVVAVVDGYSTSVKKQAGNDGSAVMRLMMLTVVILLIMVGAAMLKPARHDIEEP